VDVDRPVWRPGRLAFARRLGAGRLGVRRPFPGCWG